MSKLKIMIKNVRIIILLVFLVFAIFAINPNPWQEGIAVRGVVKNSSAYVSGMENPSPNSPPRSREVITHMNNKPIADEADYYKFVSGLEPERKVQIKTNKRTYTLETKPLVEVIELNETENRTIEEIVKVNQTINGSIVTVNKTITKIIEVQKTVTNIIGTEDIGLSIYDAPKNNIRKGLDLQGGTRVLLEPEEQISGEDMEITISNLKERLNVYGLSDVIVKDTKDLSGNNYILVEIAGANEDEVKDLLAKQGKFEAKIGNDTVFKGGGDITYVCRSASCSGIYTAGGGCAKSGDGWMCRFWFAITLTPEAAQRQADVTEGLDIITDDGQQFLSKKIELMLDNQLVDELNVGSELKGKAVTDIQITGSGSGKTQEEAIFDALKNMKRLQTILITGSLPVKLSIVQTDGVSPVLGKEFVSNAILIAFVAIISVAFIVFVRFRRWEVSVPVVFTMLTEIVLLLGFASLVGWNIDIAAIAGIIVAAGTGVDDQIVITDEVLRGGADVTYNWKQKLKNAFFIIMGAYATTVIAMVPLLFAGAGLIKGFAFTTIVGVTFGVFLTRPAFAAIIEVLLRK
ncbi:hypothetical protein ACFL96_12060 [Thermoproteota archaeon]